MLEKGNLISPIIYLTDEDYKLINNSYNLSVSTGTINVEIIKKILNDESFFSKTVDFFNNKIDKFILVYKKDNYVEKIINLNRSYIIYGILKYFEESNQYQREIKSSEKERYQILEQ